MADYDPFGAPIAGANANQRLSVVCDGETYLASQHFIGPKKFDSANTVLDSVDVERRTPLCVPVRSLLHTRYDSDCRIHIQFVRMLGDERRFRQ